MLLQEAKSGKHEEVKAAVKEVAGERDSLKAQVSSLTKKFTDVESQLQQAAKDKKGTDQQAAAKKAEAKVCTLLL